jgi:DNA polymerase III subunit delta'
MLFKDIIGNDDVKKHLQKAIINQSISNSLLFAGPDGIGKGIFASELACHLMYGENLLTDVLTRKIKQNNHPDLHLYMPEGKSETHSISSMRELISQVYMVPFEAKAKVFIIHDADRMHVASSNAILKTLEEPTLDSYIILLTSKSHVILPTILSRCSSFKFSSISDEDITTFLIAKYSISEQEATNIVKLANGSLGNAISLVGSANQVEKHNLLLKVLKRDKIKNSYFELVDDLAKFDELYSKDVIKDEKSAKWHKEIDLLFSQVLMWYRDLHLLKVKGSDNQLFHEDQVDFFQEKINFPIISLEKVNQAIDQAKISVDRNIKLSHILEALFYRLDLV